MRLYTFVVLLATTILLIDVTQAYDNYDYEEEYHSQDNGGGNNGNDYNDNKDNNQGNNDNNQGNKDDNQGNKEENQSNNQKENDDGGNGNYYNDDKPDPRQDTGPVQFPASPENLITSGVVVGASGYGFKAPEHFIGGHTYQWNEYN